MLLKTGAWATGPRDGEHALPSVPLTHEMKTSVVFVWAGESGSWTQPALALPWDLGASLTPPPPPLPAWALGIASSPKREAQSFFQRRLLSAYGVHSSRHGAEMRFLFLWSVHFG